jgi:hypothetical protein
MQSIEKSVHRMTTNSRSCHPIVALIGAVLATATGYSEVREFAPLELEFFEKNIRPVLVKNCYKCHSASAEKLKGELLLDSRSGWQQGGESGAVIVPGHPEDSVLISALRYDKFEMPPKAKLPAAVIADFEKWIAMGAPDPRSEETAPAVEAVEVFDLEARKEWWSLQPIAEVPVPEVERMNWPKSDYDRFVMAALEAKSWEPAAPSSRNSWLRRATYDLTGLPPTPEEVQDFLSDESPSAYETVVARLLDSKHFGEQWARNWMDLVRYAETKAFEADYPMPNVYQYRDYLIRAFNSDVPYDQLLKEAIAGDLLEPRLNPETGINESVIGPGYLYLTDGQHGPPDVHADEARIFDDMIDVVGKAFLSQTLACARCHDHKFDAITTKDYYSLYGVIASSRIDYADINPPEQQKEARAKLRKQKAKIREALADIVDEDMANVRVDLIAAQSGKAKTPQQKRWAGALEKLPNDAIKGLASLLAVSDEATLEASWGQLRDAAGAAQSKPGSIGEVTRASFGSWIPSGASFEEEPRPAGDFVVAAEGDASVATFVGGRPASGHLASRFAGSLKSPTFTIEGDSVSVRVKGKNVRVGLYVRHYELLGKGPTTNGTTKVINSDKWQTVVFKTNLWVGEKAYIDVQQNGGQMDFKWATGNHVDGAYAALDTATNNTPLPPLPAAGWLWGIQGPTPKSPEAVLDHVANRIGTLAKAWRDGTMTLAQSDLLESLHEAGVFDFAIARSEALKTVVAYRKLQREIPVPTYVRSLSDGHGENEPVYIRGSHENLSSAPNPRHFLDGISGKPFSEPGSGRRQWAEALVSRDNPLTARVITNRVWHYLFGRGIVASVDDFGHMGEEPSHPELLDFMARDFVEGGWSIKRLIGNLVLSSTYRMSSQASADALREDPNNLYLQHMPIRRLQAEAVRDTLLAVSGDLDPKLFGPSVGGDGGNRRSVYIQLKRRYMPEFLMTFDMPNATETFGRRNITAGPAQSLALMNSDIVWNAADKWARKILESEATEFATRIELLHRQAFGRSATVRELNWARRILADHGVNEENTNDHGLWKEICHTMLNRKELIYVY